MNLPPKLFSEVDVLNAIVTTLRREDLNDDLLKGL